MEVLKILLVEPHGSSSFVLVFKSSFMAKLAWFGVDTPCDWEEGGCSQYSKVNNDQSY